MAEQEKAQDVQTAIQVFQQKPAEIQTFELQQRAARLFAVSGLFADIKGQNPEQSIAQAFVKISLGESMGFNPAESMTGIDLIQGRVAISANMRAARMQRAGYEWDILQLDDKGCRLQLRYKGKVIMREEVDGKTGEVSMVPAVISFTANDASVAGLLGKDNYKKNPRNMFFARAITNAQRWYAPGVLSVSILSSEEVIDLLDASPSAETKAIIDRSTSKTEAVKAVIQKRAQGSRKQQDQAPETQAEHGAESQPAQEAQQAEPAQAEQPAQEDQPAQTGTSLW